MSIIIHRNINRSAQNNTYLQILCVLRSEFDCADMTESCFVGSPCARFRQDRGTFFFSPQNLELDFSDRFKVSQYGFTPDDQDHAVFFLNHPFRHHFLSPRAVITFWLAYTCITYEIDKIKFDYTSEKSSFQKYVSYTTCCWTPFVFVKCPRYRICIPVFWIYGMCDWTSVTDDDSLCGTTRIFCSCPQRFWIIRRFGTLQFHLEKKIPLTNFNSFRRIRRMSVNIYPLRQTTSMSIHLSKIPDRLSNCISMNSWTTYSSCDSTSFLHSMKLSEFSIFVFLSQFYVIPRNLSSISSRLCVFRTVNTSYFFTCNKIKSHFFLLIWLGLSWYFLSCQETFVKYLILFTFDSSFHLWKLSSSTFVHLYI